MCNIEYKRREDWDDFVTHQLPLFGAELNFHLGEVVDCPEYLAYFPLITKMLDELGMDPVYQYTFPEALNFYIEKNGEEARELLAKMEALEKLSKENVDKKDAMEYGHAIEQLRSGDTITLGTLSKSEWEVAGIYLVFGFRKRDTSN